MEKIVLILVVIFILSIIFLFSKVIGKSINLSGITSGITEANLKILFGIIGFALVVILLIKFYPSVWNFITSDIWTIILVVAMIMILFFAKDKNLKIVAGIIFLTLFFNYFSGCNKKKSNKTENCNILRVSEQITGVTYIEFNYDFSLETQGDSLYFQFPDPKKEGEFLPKVLWTGKGTYDLVDRDTGRTSGPVKIWPANPRKTVWLKIYEVRKC